MTPCTDSTFSLNTLKLPASREEEVDYLRLHDEKPDGVWRHVAPPNIQTSMAALAPVKVEALSQRSKSVLATRNTLTRHNCSMLLDKGYLPTGAENFAGKFRLLFVSAFVASTFAHSKIPISLYLVQPATSHHNQDVILVTWSTIMSSSSICFYLSILYSLFTLLLFSVSLLLLF